MELLVDLFGYLSIVVHGLTILTQSMTLGGVLFLAFLARPLAPKLGRAGQLIMARTALASGDAAIALLLAESATVALQAAGQIDTGGVTLRGVLPPGFAVAPLVKAAAAASMAFVLLGWRERAPLLPLLALAGIEL